MTDPIETILAAQLDSHGTKQLLGLPDDEFDCCVKALADDLRVHLLAPETIERVGRALSPTSTHPEDVALAEELAYDAIAAALGGGGVSVYPKASAPETPETTAAANQRADRWQQRCIEARTERDTLVDAVEGLRATMPHTLDCGLPCNCWKRWLHDALTAALDADA